MPAAPKRKKSAKPAPSTLHEDLADILTVALEHVRERDAEAGIDLDTTIEIFKGRKDVTTNAAEVKPAIRNAGAAYRALKASTGPEWEEAERLIREALLIVRNADQRMLPTPGE